jgi:hypothetical protein
MKIREGFVSNSSSSSFIIVCKSVTIENIDDTDIWFEGHGLSEGIDFFELEPETKEIIKTRGLPEDCYLLKVAKYSCEYDMNIDDDFSSLAKKGYTIKSIEVDNWTSQEAGIFEEEYYEE